MTTDVSSSSLPPVADPRPARARCNGSRVLIIAEPSGRGLFGWTIGFGSSVLADQMFFLALTWAALQVGTPRQVGVVLAAGSLPRLLILLVGGAVADQVSPKRIIVGTDTGRAVVMAAAAVLLLLGSMST